MGNINKSELKNILSPLKSKIDNCIDKETLNKKLEKKLSLTGGSLVGPLTIINGASNIILSAQQDSARLSIGTNHLDLTNDGKLKVNDKEVGSNKALEADLSSKLSLTGGTLTGSLSIKNGDTTSTLSTESNSARLSIGNNHLDLTSDGKLKVNDKEVGVDESLKSEVENKLSLTGGTLTGSLSIKNGDTTSTLSTESNSARLSIGNNHLDLTSDGKLKVNDKEVGLSEDIQNNVEVKLDDSLIKVTKETGETKNDYFVKNYIPYRYIGPRSVPSIGDYIYLFGSNYGSTTAYKYDIRKDEYTKIANIPEDVTDNSAVTSCFGHPYIFGAGSVSKSVYKYDTATNTYSKMKDLPAIMSHGSAFNNGTGIIYLFGLGSGNQEEYYYIYTFDTATNTYTKQGNMANNETFEYGCGVIKDSYIYLFGGGINGNKYFKYSINTNECTEFPSNTPISLTHASVANTNGTIYTLGGNSEPKYVYKYDTDTDTFTKMNDLPFNVNDSGCTAHYNMIYTFGGQSNDSQTYRYNPIPYAVTVTYNAIVKPTGHNIFTKDYSYTSTKAALVKIGSSDYYTEYDENNNVIKNTATISGTGSTKIYVKSGGKFHGKALSGSGWTTINILDYI